MGRPTIAATPDSTSADNTKTPRGALLRSAALPGWGQHYNDRPIKMLFFGTASATALTAIVVEHRRINTALTPEIHQNRAARRNTRLLYLALCTSFAAIDAYVDAHLADFGPDVQLQIRPGGALLKFNATLTWR